MALAEIEHPLAKELGVILGAVEQGLAQSDLLPMYTFLGYDSPLDRSDGVARISIANTQTDNFGVIYIPVFTESNPHLSIVNQKGKRLTDARIMLADFHGEEFGIPIGDEIVVSKIIQFDVHEDGLIFSAFVDTERLSLYGDYESEIYDNCRDIVREQTGLPGLYASAIQFLDQVA